MVRAYLNPQLIPKVRNTNWIVRYQRVGCNNRLFFRIVVHRRMWRWDSKPREVLGCHDPYINEHGEKVTSIDLDRVSYWLGRRAAISEPVAQQLGLMGYLPVHPKSYLAAYRERKNLDASGHDEGDVDASSRDEGDVDASDIDASDIDASDIDEGKADMSHPLRTFVAKPRRWVRRGGKEMLDVQFDEASQFPQPAVITKSSSTTSPSSSSLKGDDD